MHSIGSSAPASPKAASGAAPYLRWIRSLDDVFEHSPDRLCLWGRIWRIDGQTLHTFWFEVTREGQSDHFAWFLYFDTPENSGRRRPRTFDHHDAAEEIEWRAKIVGEAIVQAEKLAIVPGSTRALIRDLPESEPRPTTWDHRRGGSRRRRPR